jgi:Cof subfamily protein (haloacid dehalogenase superfamily)
MFKLIACDLDGTLLDAHHRVGRLSAETIRAVVARGVKFVIATGRHIGQIGAIREQIGIHSDVITCNGARVHDESGQVTYRQDLDLDLVRELSHPALARDSVVNLYTDHEWLADRAATRPSAVPLDGFHYRIHDPEALHGHGIAKLFYMAAPAVLLDIERDLLLAYGDRITLAFSLDDCLEVTAPAVNKGQALAALLETNGISPAECLAFGDGMNDIQMLQVAGKALVMGNASPRVKTALPHLETIGSNTDEAMAHYLRRLYQL